MAEGAPGPITGEIADFVHAQRLGFHATVSPEGTANVSPKGTTAVFDDHHLMFAEIRSPRTVANLAVNPSIEVNVVDPITRRGYRFKGIGSVHDDEETIERAFVAFHAAGYSPRRERTRGVVLIRVDAVAALTSPAYDDGSSEEDVAARWAARLIERARRWLPDFRESALPDDDAGRAGAGSC
ncbi:MAG: pyridoxamine 5'-phosphate oxidase family protein [Actinomycetota bacterium]|nr:pyridoxamine 5'-phosphate oxidase family protein [Actinomycetota bacterium]